VFMPPDLNINTHSMVIFTWLLVTVCIYNAFYSGWMMNYNSLFPNKFRSDKGKRKITVAGSPLGLLATGFGILLPPLFIEYGNKQSYILAMFIMSIISFSIFLLSIPGTREMEEMRKEAINSTRMMEKHDSFLKAFRIAINHKNFIAYLISYLCFNSLIIIILASIPYIIPYVLGLHAINEIAIYAALLVGQLVGLVLWIKIANKLEHRNLFLIGFIWAILVLIPIIFLNELWSIALFIGILGFGLGSIYHGSQLVFSDCMDEIVIDSGKRQESTFLRIRTFMVSLSIIIQAITFWSVHVTTGFDPGLQNQTVLALWGLRFQFALAPLIIMLVAAIIFWYFYDLSPEKIKKNKEKLHELNI